MKQQNRSLTIRVDATLHQKYVDKAIKRSVKEAKIIKVSELVREALEKGIE